MKGGGSMARRNSYTGEFRLTKAEYLSAKYYALRYNAWKEEHRNLLSLRAVDYDGMPGGGGVGNPTEKIGIRGSELFARINVIERTAEEVSPEFARFILRRATDGVSYEYMNSCQGLHVSRRTFCRLMRRFYFLLAQKI